MPQIDEMVKFGPGVVPGPGSLTKEVFNPGNRCCLVMPSPGY